MAVSEAKKRADAKWHKANTKSAACSLSLAEHAAFKAYAAARGKTISGLLLDYVRSCIADMEQQENIEQPVSTEQKSRTE